VVLTVSVVETIVETLWGFAVKHFGALQVCWLCLAATLGGGWFFAANYARADAVGQMRAELNELKGDAIAKRIFDYRVRQCDAPASERQQKLWLAEQIRKDMAKYRQTTGEGFGMPACTDL
jgi:hypothetical protein